MMTEVIKKERTTCTNARKFAPVVGVERPLLLGVDLDCGGIRGGLLADFTAHQTTHEQGEHDKLHDNLPEEWLLVTDVVE